MLRLDHVSFAAQPDGCAATAERIAEQLGIKPYDGGLHPRFGTRNMIFPLDDGHYLEVVEALEHPAAQITPFGQAVRAQSARGGGWMGWCVAVDDTDSVSERLERPWVPGNRTPEGGEELHWKQIGVKGLIADPQLPYFIHWDSPAEQHPSARIRLAVAKTAIIALAIAGSRDRLRNWLGSQDPKPIPEISIDWTAPDGLPGIEYVTFQTARGEVVI
ncbi:VOC family protein [Brevibacterium moorei]|uniref:VOC family protein n=1 Tax=Brevibacterium moorei TaxID=2968457 RepID=UPI00211C839A|nr:VOC family protein [Brevibacterium sp. 68QC2CO]MCQ9385504.1 VOC family protein [Brevibacterium sp. 68QC2CO]